MKLQENTHVEFKQEYTDDLKKTILAFANTHGGVIYIGVADDGTIIGLSNVDEVMLQVTNSIKNAIKPDISLLVDLEIEEIEGIDIIKVSIQEGAAKPYWIAKKGPRPEGVFLRHGSATVPASDAAILRLIKESDGENFENMRTINQDLSFETAERAFKQSRVEFASHQRKSLGLMTKDGIYTNLGYLISDQCAHTIKAAVFQGTTKAAFRDRKEFSGSLFQQLDEAYDYIDRYNKTKGEIEGLYRIDSRDYPPTAVREVLLNAIVHRDYSLSAPTLISIFDDRIEILTAGGLVKGTEIEDILLGYSMARNERLASIFFRLKLVEAYGTGIRKTLDSYDDYEKKPLIEVSPNAFKITLPNVNEITATHDDLSIFTHEELSAFTHRELSSFTRQELQVLRMFSSSTSITRNEVEKALGISQSGAVKLLAGLARKGAIEKVGGSRNTHYLRRP